MAHNRTKIEGFENGAAGTLASVFLDGVSGTAYSIQGSTVRTGSYALRLNPTTSTVLVQICNAVDATGNGLQPNAVNAMRVRAYLNFASFPTTTCHVFGTLDATVGPAEISIRLDSTGLVYFDGVSTGTTISTGIWYRFEFEHDWTNASRVLRLNGVVIKSNTTAGDKSGQIFFGNGVTGGSSSTFDMFVDDVVIETSTDIANIDWPGEGGIYCPDFTGDGTHDTTVAAGGAGANVPGWEVTTHPDTYLSLNRPYNAETSLAQTADDSSSYLEAKLTMTKETLAAAGVPSTVSCVQVTIAVKAGVGTAPHRIMATLSGSGDTDLTTGGTIGTTAYEAFHWISATRPSGFGGGAWTAADFNAMEFGVHFPATSGGRLRCALVLVQVEAAPESITGGSSTVLTQLEMTTGSFWNAGSYSPRIRTIQITSEALGRPNEAMNVIACSVRYIAQGAGTIRASWWFDYLTTHGFTFPSNPIQYQAVGANTGVSTFEFGASSMVDDDQVYTQHFIVDGSGKFFQLEFSQTGLQPLRLLAVDLEVKPEGRREAYLDGVY